MNNTKEGLSISNGIAIAKIHHLYEKSDVIIKKKGKGFNYESKVLEESLEKAILELETLAKYSSQKVGIEESTIFSAQAMMLKDPVVLESIHKKINKYNYNASYAFRITMSEMIDLFDASDNLYMKERIYDIKDITKRVLNILSDSKSEELNLTEDVILVAEELFPSTTISLDKKHIKGIITLHGSKTSHTAILARQLGIPAITGVPIDDFIQDEVVIMDAKKGLIITNPSVKMIEDYLELVKQVARQNKEHLKYKDLNPVHLDGVPVVINANIGSKQDLALAHELGAEGIGLLRTENQYMENTVFPTEESLYNFYKEALISFKDSKIVVRTLDIGGDKELPYLDIKQEINPFLGHRGIRFTLTHQDLFKTQLTALLKASSHGNLNIMFPMISVVDEIKEAKKLLNEVHNFLTLQNLDIKLPKVGIMIEVPVAALNIKRLAKHVDFVSIGTNDLIQYLFAADRMNDKVNNLYQPYHPVLLETIKKIVDEAHKENIRVSVCGEMAGHPKQALLLLGLGVDELSMNSLQIPEIKHLISKTKHEDLNQLANKALELSTDQEVSDLVESYIKKLDI